MSAIKLYDELIASGIVGANGTTYKVVTEKYQEKSGNPL